MTDCTHAHTKCQECFRDITGGDKPIPLATAALGPALVRIKELEDELDLAEGEALSLRRKLDAANKLIRDFREFIKGNDNENS